MATVHIFPLPGLQLAYDTAFDTLLATVDRRTRLDEAFAAMAADSTFTPVVTRLGCLRGVSTLAAFGLAVEIGDFHRLSGRSIGAYLGLLPTESSSGASRSQGSITKTGNGHARRPLVEAAWHHRRPYRPGIDLRKATGVCTPGGTSSTTVANVRSLPTPPSPASSPAGVWLLPRPLAMSTFGATVVLVELPDPAAVQIPAMM